VGLVLPWRIRTVVDDTGITQYWVRRSYRVLFTEVTAIETEYGLGRWFLRIHSGERTAEFVPCHMLLSGRGVPPRTLRAARLDIDRAVDHGQSDPASL
jgi:hypothetical protein